MSITEFLEARIAEDEATATPRAVVVSGGWPAPEVPNCVGADGRGGCGWRMDPPEGAERWWWKAPEPQKMMRDHEYTHVTPQQKRALAECAAKRAILEEHGLDGHSTKDYCETCADWWKSELREGPPPVAWPCPTLRAIAAVYADHPDYQEAWRA